MEAKAKAEKKFIVTEIVKVKKTKHIINLFLDNELFFDSFQEAEYYLINDESQIKEGHTYEILTVYKKGEI